MGFKRYVTRNFPEVFMGKWARKIVQDFIFILTRIVYMEFKMLLTRIFPLEFISELTRIPNLGFNYILARISSLGFIYQKTRKISLGFMMEKAGRCVIPPCNHLSYIYMPSSSSSVSSGISVSSTNSSLGGM